MNKGFFSVFLCLIVFFSTTFSAAEMPEKVYGVWYSVADGTDEATLRSDMKKITDFGFNTVFFPAYVWQKDAISMDVEPPSEQYLKTLGLAIDAAKQSGLSVTVTGFLLVRDGTWRGQIMPPGKERWAKSYFTAIQPHLDLAQEKGVDAFCVASEMESLKREPKIWIKVISEARKSYSGKIGFNVNWWHNGAALTAIVNMMGWMKNLDFIGFSGYFELTDSDTPTRDRLAAAWSGDRHGQNLMEQFVTIGAKYPGIKLYLWEIGYRSANGANMHPWNWGDKADADAGEQADCFAAFFSIFPKTALDGFAIWDLYPGLKKDETGYSFMGKPAEEVVRGFLGSVGK